MTGWTGRRVALLALLMWLPLLVIAPTGLFLVDEVVQYASIVSFARGGSFVVDNGYAEYGSADLRMQYLSNGPDGLVAQYPFLFTVLAAPFFALAGLRGVFLLNLLGALASLWLTWRISERLSDRRTAVLATLILLLASFLSNYAVALWPHAISLAFALAGAYCAVVAGSTRQVEPIPALAGGALIAAGIFLRLDVALILPPLAAWLVLTADRPYAKLLLAGLGMAPVILAGSWINQVKFGVFSPITYGADKGGGTSLTTHLPIIAVVAAACLLIVLWRQAPRVRRPLIGLIALLAVGGIAALPELRAAILKMAQGLYVLVVDLTQHPAVGVAKGIERDKNGIVTFWNFHKKALAQSLPWMGLLPLLVRADVRHRSGILLASLVSVTVVLPFAAFAWHGGLAPNMRYFMFAVPFLAYLGAVAIWTLADKTAPNARTLIRSALITLAALVLLGTLVPEYAGHLIEYRFTLALFVGTLTLTTYAAVRQRYPKLLWPVVAATLITSTYVAYVKDVLTTLSFRAHADTVGRAYAELVPPGSVVYDNFIQAQWALVERGDSLIAISGTTEGGIDPDFVREASEDGRSFIVNDPQILDLMKSALAGVPFKTSVLAEIAGKNYYLIQPETE